MAIRSASDATTCPAITHSGRDLAVAVSLGRALLSLQRSERTGVLHVTGPAGPLRMAIVGGAIRAVGSRRGDPTLGDSLIEQGALDLEAHRAALRAVPKTEPVGQWLVRAGAARPEAVAWAVRAQFVRRCVGVFGGGMSAYRFTPGTADVGAPHLSEGLAADDVVIRGLRAAYANVPVEDALRGLERSVLRLTAGGRQLVRRAALWPDEAALVTLLKRGTALSVIRAGVKGGARPLRLLGALHALSVVQGSRARATSYSLLVRKRRQLRAAAGPHVLLDLPAGARPTEARRALHRLASQLHPDCFGPHAPQAVRTASGEVMAALVRAETALR